MGVSFFVWICCYAGILVYATYYGCDPLSLGRIKADDQILPLFVMETVGHLRGVPGLFIAGVFGAALRLREKLNIFFQLASSLSAIAASTTCGIFTLGMLFPWANSYGAIIGALAGAIMSGLVSFGGQFVSAANLVVTHKLPVFVNETCFEKYGLDPNITIPEVSIAYNNNYYSR
ncbi:hypothetical protein NQ314_013096 [Rhamnusium bicolor]|uniref:Uncharacterized protein n=1 Tax=Rhamnusium bicolor TaxID=1586634 RepID=A0AAV8X8H6_9CUCU|nr:hypothetical protein NQ314_013096 [Rhamnusium bicolor]